MCLSEYVAYNGTVFDACIVHIRLHRDIDVLYSHRSPSLTSRPLPVRPHPPRLGQHRPSGPVIMLTSQIIHGMSSRVTDRRFRSRSVLQSSQHGRWRHLVFHSPLPLAWLCTQIPAVDKVLHLNNVLHFIDLRFSRPVCFSLTFPLIGRAGFHCRIRATLTHSVLYNTCTSAHYRGVYNSHVKVDKHYKIVDINPLFTWFDQ